MLGITRRGGAGAGGADVIAPWQDAAKAIDGRLAGLARELRSYGDVDFNQLADKGIHQLLDGNETAALTAGLAAYNAATGEARQKAAAALRRQSELSGVPGAQRAGRGARRQPVRG